MRASCVKDDEAWCWREAFVVPRLATSALPIDCYNTTEALLSGGKRNLAIQQCLEKRPDAFTKKRRKSGLVVLAKTIDA